MRRLLPVLAIALIAAAALSAGAFAKEGGVELSSVPFGTKPGDPWTGSLTLIGSPELVADARPTITTKNLSTGKTQVFTPKRDTSGKPNIFHFSVVFPAPGRYSYTVRDGVTDREYTYPVVLIAPTAASIPNTGGDSNSRSFPLWPIIGGAGGAGLLALAAVAALRGRRFGLSH
ncbi:MAG TPA: hypothetical protein VGJ27_04110 [Gaiellaceae bacterium]